MTITVLPNQSMMDVIIQCLGSLEAGMEFCALNGVGISDVPVVGTVYQVPVSVNADAGVLQYLAQRGIVVGNFNIAPGTENLVSEDGSEGLGSEDGSERLVSED